MIKIQDNRLHHGGMSFLLPDGFYLATAQDVEREHGMTFYSEDKTFFLAVEFWEGEETAEGHMKAYRQAYIDAMEVLYGDKHPEVEPIKAYGLNGLKGFALKHDDGFCAYFDAVGDSNIHLCFYIETTGKGMEENANIDEILARQEVRVFLANMKAEQ